MVQLDTYKFVKNDTVGVVVEYNTVIKKYATGLEKIRLNSYSNIKGLPKNNKHTGTSTEEQLERYRKKRVFKKQEQIRDLAYNFNKWEYFVTLTFDDSLMNNAYSHDKAINLLIKWINNQKVQNPNITYLLVPELHKSGRLHFHGLFANAPKWKLSPAISPKGRAIYKNGSKIYNLINYKLGFTTVSEIKDIDKVSFYISKYMSKELLNLKNKKNFWHSKNLKYPEKTYYLANTQNVKEYLKQYTIQHENVSETANSSSYFAKYSTSDN